MILSQPRLELLWLHLDVPQNLAHESGANRLSRMTGHYGRPTISMPKEMMTASDSQNQESGTLERGDNLTPTESPQPAHTQSAMR